MPPRTGLLLPFLPPNPCVDDVLKRGQAGTRGGRPACGAELWEEPAQEAWLGWAVCLVCLPPSSPGRQAAFLEHSRPPLCALSGVCSPLVLPCLPR